MRGRSLQSTEPVLTQPVTTDAEAEEYLVDRGFIPPMKKCVRCSARHLKMIARTTHHPSHWRLMLCFSQTYFNRDKKMKLETHTSQGVWPVEKCSTSSSTLASVDSSVML